MKHACLIGVFAVLVGVSLAAQGAGQAPAPGGGGGGRGNQPPDFQTKMPWAAWEGGYNSARAGLPQIGEPFKMFDNIWYVGTENDSVLVINTSAGIILIDTANANTAEGVLANIRKAGFDPKNIKYILISHGHNDHFGGAGRIKQEAPDARIGVSGPDWDLIMLQQGMNGAGLPLTKDLVLKDKDQIKLGDTTVIAHDESGHSIGAMAFEIPAKLGGKTYRLINMRLSIRQANVLMLDEMYVNSIKRLIERGPWDGILPEHAFTAILRGPLTAKDVYMGYHPNPKMEGPNASVQGKAFTTAFLNDVLKVAQEKWDYDKTHPLPTPALIPNTTTLPSPYGK